MDDRHWVMYAAIFACIVCATLYCTGFYADSSAGSKFWLLAKTFYGRAIGAIDKRLISETKADTTSRNRRGFWLNSLKIEFEERSQMPAFFVLGDSSDLLQSNRTCD
ncbi:hypothetical protein [Microcoleus vaginatus]|uniref:hypothetical protein n=1 Tax=Microcoleus vaginatus TaxID=119532 RepID=UPI00403F93BB